MSTAGILMSPPSVTRLCHSPRHMVENHYLIQHFVTPCMCRDCITFRRHCPHGYSFYLLWSWWRPWQVIIFTYSYFALFSTTRRTLPGSRLFWDGAYANSNHIFLHDGILARFIFNLQQLTKRNPLVCNEPVGILFSVGTVLTVLRSAATVNRALCKPCFT